MSYGTESVRNRHRPGIRVQDTREYGGPTKGGTRHKRHSTNKTLQEIRQHKYDRGDLFIDGVPREEFV